MRKPVLNSCDSACLLIALIFVSSIHAATCQEVRTEAQVIDLVKKGQLYTAECETAIIATGQKLYLKMPLVTTGTTSNVELSFKNRLDAQILTLRAKSTCGCIVPKLFEDKIASNESFKIHLKLRPDVKSYSTTILVHGDVGNGDAQLFELTLQGECDLPLEIRQKTVCVDSEDRNLRIPVEMSISQDVNDIDLSRVSAKLGSLKQDVIDCCLDETNRKLSFTINISTNESIHNHGPVFVSVPYKYEASDELKNFTDSIAVIERKATYFHPSRIVFRRKDNNWISKTILHCSELVDFDKFKLHQSFFVGKSSANSGLTEIPGVELSLKRLSEVSTLVIIKMGSEGVDLGDTGVLGVRTSKSNESVSVPWILEQLPREN